MPTAEGGAVHRHESAVLDGGPLLSSLCVPAVLPSSHSIIFVPGPQSVTLPTDLPSSARAVSKNPANPAAREMRTARVAARAQPSCAHAPRRCLPCEHNAPTVEASAEPPWTAGPCAHQQTKLRWRGPQSRAVRAARKLRRAHISIPVYDLLGAYAVAICERASPGSSASASITVRPKAPSEGAVCTPWPRTPLQFGAPARKPHAGCKRSTPASSAQTAAGSARAQTPRVTRICEIV